MIQGCCEEEEMCEERKELKIGSVELPNNLILAPMAGVSDLPFRLLCREQGAGLTVMEMVSAKAILYKNKNTKELMRTVPEDRPVSLQLFGSDPDIVSEIALQIEEQPFDILDFNMGCPVPKVVKNGEGSALMRDPVRAAEIVRSCVKKIHKPMTVKIRKGFNDHEVNAVEVAKRLEDAGAAAVAVHGRTREQYYSGEADWDIIRRVKEAVKIPVIGNGDITGPESALAMVEQTGCDAVMIGRAARGNPWIFRRILDAFTATETAARGSYTEAAAADSNIEAAAADSNGIIATEAAVRDSNGIKVSVDAGTDFAGRPVPAGKPETGELKEVILRHAQMMIDMDGEYAGMRKMRKHVAWYTAGYPHSSKLRALSNNIESMEDLRNLLTLLDV